MIVGESFIKIIDVEIVIYWGRTLLKQDAY